jgi:hypothetical protein
MLINWASLHREMLVYEDFARFSSGAQTPSRPFPSCHEALRLNPMRSRRWVKSTPDRSERRCAPFVGPVVLLELDPIGARSFSSAVIASLSRGTPRGETGQPGAFLLGDVGVDPHKREETA